jgi:hypothetical protein
MTTRRWIGGLICAVIAGALIGWWVGHRSGRYGEAGGPAPVIASIAFTQVVTGCDRILTVPDPITLEKKNGKLTFTITNDCAVEVTMWLDKWQLEGQPETPWEGEGATAHHITIPPHQVLPLALIVKGEVKFGTYKYSVFWTAPGQGPQERDPGLIIKP